MFNTSELDELFRILNSIKGFKLRQPQWSNTTIAHLVDKEEGEIPQLFKGTKLKQPEVEENLKENLRNKDKTHQKPKRSMKPIHMKTLIIIITMPLVRVEATDLVMVKVVTNNLEGSHNETEAKDLSIVNISFKVIAIREAHLNKTVLNTVIIVNPFFREIKPWPSAIQRTRPWKG